MFDKFFCGKWGFTVVRAPDSRKADMSVRGMPLATNCIAFATGTCRIVSERRGTYLGILFSNHAQQGGSCSVS
jgi:hypothetical protein